MTNIKDIRNYLNKMDLDLKMLEEKVVPLNSGFEILEKDCVSLMKKVALNKRANNINDRNYNGTSNNENEKELEIHFSDDILKIEIPELLPARLKNNNTSTFTETYYRAAFRTYFQNHEDIKYKEKVLITIETRCNNKQRLLDYDNMAIKHIIDVIAFYIMADDSPLDYELYMKSCLDKEEQNKTIITVEPCH